MEPIRSETHRGLDRKRKKKTTGHESIEDGFSARLEKTDDIGAESGIEESGSLDFSGLLDVSAPAEKLYDAVHQAGQKLLQDRTYTSAQRYREAVRRFLRKVVPEASGITIHESNRDILSRKRYYLLTTVNRSVDRLITGLLQSQHEQLDMLRRLEEIEGLLVDLMQ